LLQGCDASLLLKASSGQKSGLSERESPPNLTVEGYEVMDRIKAAVDEQCDPDVSCADLLAIGSM
jgi:peroxidase